MQEELTEKSIQKLMEIKGRINGVPFKTDMEFVLKEKGEEGLKKLEEELKRMKHPIEYKKSRTTEFYPAGLRVLSLLTIKKIFDFDDKKIEDMGFFAVKVSFFAKLLIKYYISPEKVFFKKAPGLWRKQATEGELVPVEFDKKRKQAIVRLKNINLHPLYCRYLQGYISGILKMLIVTEKITCRETKCSFKGDEYHEYLIKWE